MSTNLCFITLKLILLFTFLIVIKCDVSILKIDDLYLDYAKLKYDYIDDSEGVILESLLCIPEESQKNETCFGRVIY